jgi:hypothetical protein
MSKIYWEVLSDLQKKELKNLIFLSKIGVLAGGTALALQLGHRRSFDFDIFLKKEISSHFSIKLQKIFGKKIKILNETSEELSFLTDLDLKISLVYYPFAPIYSLVKTPFISLFHWRDIILDKAYIIGRRPQYRDYVDLFFVLKKRKMTLPSIIQKAEEKFGGLFSEKLFLGQLSYLEDIKNFSVEFLREKYTPKEIKNFFENLVKIYIQKKIKKK